MVLQRNFLKNGKVFVEKMKMANLAIKNWVLLVGSAEDSKKVLWNTKKNL